MNKDQVQGRATEAKGAIKQAAGTVVGNERSGAVVRRRTATPSRRSRRASTRFEKPNLSSASTRLRGVMEIPAPCRDRDAALYDGRAFEHPATSEVRESTRTC